jgi:hypothetical protein
MRASLAIGLFCTVLFAMTGLASAKGPFNPIKIGNWSGGAFTDDQTGAFSHCAAAVNYNSGINMVVSVQRTGEWRLGFNENSWQLTIGQAIPVDLTFDGNGPVRVYAIPQTTNLAVVSMPPNSALVKAFMNAHIMNAFANGNLFTFRLSETAKLMPVLVQCSRNEGRTQEVKAIPDKVPLTPSPAASTKTISEADAERSKLITEAAAEHGRCLASQMRSIVPYSNENAEVLSQVVITKCSEAENKFVRLGMALFNTSRVDMEKLVVPALAEQKRKMVADIVTFRAELTKALASQPKDKGLTPASQAEEKI